MTQAQAVRFEQTGSPEVLTFQEIDLPAPGEGEIQIRQTAIGLNFLDIYHRRGGYGAPLPLPSGLGVEGVGEITAIGDGVTDFEIGQRIAYVGGPPGAYATMRNLPAARALVAPEGIGNAELAAIIFKGLTAEYLIHRCAPVKKRHLVLFHAAAGGVGSIATHWMHRIGATVFATVGSEEKAEIARANGCDYVINYNEQDFEAEVKRLTRGRGVDVVFDSVGADTFDKSLNSLRQRGLMVSFGEASRPIPPMSVATLGAKGSLYLTRPSIAHYTNVREEYQAGADNLFRAIRKGDVKPPRITTYALADVQKAHADVEGRRTTGSVVLLP